MGDNDITIVIPTLNEPHEVLAATVDGLLSSSAKTSIIVVDDGSDEKASLKKVTMIRNPRRLGSAASRAIGIAHARTPIILTTDAHVRFTTRGWDDRLRNLLSDDGKRIVCPTCIPVGETGFRGKLYGGDVTVASTGSGKPAVFLPVWRTSPSSDGTVGCVMGGAYAFAAEWYRKIGGYRGIKGWCPTELVAISLKTRMCGGTCFVDQAIEMEHRFREKAPFDVDPILTTYNKVRLAMTILPLRESTAVPTLMFMEPGVREAMKMILDDARDIHSDKLEFERAVGIDLQVAIGRAGLGVSLPGMA